MSLKLLIDEDAQDKVLVNSQHPGILAVYQEANPSKKMSFQAIVRAIVNLEAAKVPLANQFISLNHWNY